MQHNKTLSYFYKVVIAAKLQVHYMLFARRQILEVSINIVNLFTTTCLYAPNNHSL